jgi:hypothetical protein
MLLYWSNATNPTARTDQLMDGIYADSTNLLMPALIELPIMRVVHPAYHCLPNGGHGSFLPSANLRLSCVRVFATSYSLVRSGELNMGEIRRLEHSAGYVIAIHLLVY